MGIEGQRLSIELRKEHGGIVPTRREIPTEEALIFRPEEPPIPTTLLALSEEGDSAIVRMGTDDDPQFARLSYDDVIPLKDEIDAVKARDYGMYLDGHVSFSSLGEAQAAIRAYRNTLPERDMSFLPPQPKTYYEMVGYMTQFTVDNLKLIKDHSERDGRNERWPNQVAQFFLSGIERYTHDEYDSIEVRAFIEPLQDLVQADPNVHDKHEFVRVILGKKDEVWEEISVQLEKERASMDEFTWGRAVGKAFGQHVIQFRGENDELRDINVSDSVLSARIAKVQENVAGLRAHFVMFRDTIMQRPDVTTGFIQGIIDHVESIQIPPDDVLPYLKNESST